MSIISNIKHKRSRKLERNYARDNGYFWLPCPICGEYFGGHEIMWLVDFFPQVSTFVDSQDTPGNGRAICPDCANAGKGDPSYARLDKSDDQTVGLPA